MVAQLNRAATEIDRNLFARYDACPSIAASVLCDFIRLEAAVCLCHGAIPQVVELEGCHGSKVTLKVL